MCLDDVDVSVTLNNSRGGNLEPLIAGESILMHLDYSLKTHPANPVSTKRFLRANKSSQFPGSRTPVAQISTPTDVPDKVLQAAANMEL